MADKLVQIGWTLTKWVTLPIVAAGTIWYILKSRKEINR